MKPIRIIPFDISDHGFKNSYYWLTWPGMDEHPNGYEFSGVAKREKIFGLNQGIQAIVANEVFFKMRTGVAGGFPISNKAGEFVTNMPLSLHEEVHGRIEE